VVAYSRIFATIPPIYASISDDLTDVWNDVKKGLSIFDSGKPNCIEDAVWNWRFLFGSHWGHHTAGAIWALTALVAGEFTDGRGASIRLPGRHFQLSPDI